MRKGTRFLVLLAAIFTTALAIPQSMAMDTNGWNIITQQDPSSSLAHIRFVVRAGSLSDPANLPGLAYFTARAILRGTETRPYQDLNNAIETLGGTISVSVDPTQTTFTATVLSQNLDAFLDVMRDVFTEPAFSVTEMNLLQQLLFGELRSDLQDTRTLASRALMQVAYAGTPLQNPVEGTISSISNITPQNAVDFFKNHYFRENMIIAISSPLSDQDAVAKLELKLAPLASCGQASDPACPAIPKLPASNLKGIQAVIVDRKGLSTVPTFVATSGVSDADADLPALETGNFVFGEDFTSRLMQVLRAQNGWTYGAYSSFNQLLQPKSEAGLFSLYFFPSTQYFENCVTKAVSMLDDYAAQGVTADELTFAKQSLVNRYPFQLDSAEKRLDQMLRSTLTGRPVLTPTQYADQINGLDLTKLNATIAARTDTQDLAIAVVGDADTLKPILSALPKVNSVTVVQINP